MFKNITPEHFRVLNSPLFIGMAMNMPILRVILSFYSQTVSHTMFVPLTAALPALRDRRKCNEELTDRACYFTSTTGQSPANPCADSQDVALIHRPQPRC